MTIRGILETVALHLVPNDHARSPRKLPRSMSTTVYPVTGLMEAAARRLLWARFQTCDQNGLHL